MVWLKQHQPTRLLRLCFRIWNGWGQESDGSSWAPGHNFPFALQLCCFLHFKKNVKEKLHVRELPIPNNVSQEFLDDIFGKHKGNVRIEGLVDVSSVEDLDHKLNALEGPWNVRKSPHAGQTGPQFLDHFTGADLRGNLGPIPPLPRISNDACDNEFLLFEKDWMNTTRRPCILRLCQTGRKGTAYPFHTLSSSSIYVVALTSQAPLLSAWPYSSV